MSPQYLLNCKKREVIGWVEHRINKRLAMLARLSIGFEIKRHSILGTDWNMVATKLV